MKTYVVNMAKDSKKRLVIIEQLIEHPELNYNIWAATEGAKLTKEEQEETILPEYYHRYGRNATLPAVGCALSHIEIYRDILSSDTKFALILEDDAIISRDLKIDDITTLLNTNDPVAILLTPEFWYRKENLTCRIDKKYCIFKLNGGYMTSGYAINASAAKILLEVNYPVKYMADEWGVFVRNGLKLYGIVPHVISYPDGYGEIGLSQHVHKSILEKTRSIIVFIYIRFLWTIYYLKGNKKSTKKWK